MNQPIRRVAVLGAGVMGGGIAAHVANAGVPVLLLDIVPPNLSDAERKQRSARDRLAANALAALNKSRPASFFTAGNARLVEIGNLEDDIERLAQCDLIIEAVIERLDIKRKLFDKLQAIAHDGTLIASNTSGLRIHDMLEGLSPGFRQRFLVMHFFNPPRYMKLLELCAGPDTSAETMERARYFGEEVLGKGIAVAKDTPNFIANRIGAHSMMATIHLMLERGLAPEDVDAITGIPMGHPKSAVFRTGDVVGIDTLTHVVDNCYKVLTDDEDRDVFKVPDYIRTMLEKKQLGDKTRGGFLRKAGDKIETLDPKTGEYRAKGGDPAIAKACKELGKEEDVKARVKALVAAPAPVGDFAWQVLSRSMAYAARRLGEISDDVATIDDAMRWGYNWELGPFQTWDALGFAATTERMKKEGIALPDSIEKMLKSGATGFYDDKGRVYQPTKGGYQERKLDPRNASIEIMRRGQNPVLANGGAEAWDLGDGVLGLTFRSKANSVDPNVIAMMTQSVERAERDFKALLIANRGEHFCVGANLFLVVMAAQQKNWEQIRGIVRSFQAANQRMKYASVPVVAAPYGMTVGGGMEICFGASAVQAAAETYAGLVEVGVGLIPGGGGTVNMLWRALESIPDGVDFDIYPVVTQVFKNIATARVATSAAEAQRFGYFRIGDGVSFDRERQLWEAKKRALAMAESGYHAPVPRAYKLPGESGISTLQMFIDTMMASGYASEHDARIGARLARVLCGGVGGAAREVTEEDMLELECEAFVSLCGEQKSLERMQYMLMNNKPLRN